MSNTQVCLLSIKKRKRKERKEKNRYFRIQERKVCFYVFTELLGAMFD